MYNKKIFNSSYIRNVLTETLLGLRDEVEAENRSENENPELKEELAEIFDFNYYQIGDRFKIYFFFLVH